MLKIEKRTALDLSVTEKQLYVTVLGKSIEGRVEEHRLDESR